MKYKITFQEIEGNRLKKIRIDTNYLEYNSQYTKIIDILDEAETPYKIIIEDYFANAYKLIFSCYSTYNEITPPKLNKFLAEMPVFIFILFENEIDLDKHLEYLLLDKLSEDNNDKMG